GNKIQASCKKNYLLSLGADCRVGEWKNLENFVITPAGGGYRPTNHPYKLSFMKFTSIEPYEYNNIDMFLDLVEFETILSGQLDNNLLIDVVGQAIDIGEKLTLQCSNGKEKKKIEFTLRDINDERIPCCLWGNFADTSQLLINPPIDESAALKEIFKVHLLLKDDTGTTKFMLLDSIANGIIVESAEKILKGSLNEIEDPEMLPQSLRDVIGKTYKFGVIIEKNNVAYGSKSYKVAKVWSISNMLMVASQSETKSALDTTLPVDEHISLLTDGEESSETLKTPTSKRSQALKDDVPEHTSTSKRQRGKSIKMEK
ncbi:hypothetical protein IGI04_013032, partial [Brassica rapa subsp. trilocularis]